MCFIFQMSIIYFYLFVFVTLIQREGNLSLSLSSCTLPIYSIFHSLSSFLYIHLYYNFIILFDFLQGLYLEITGPTQKDLKLRAHLDYEEVSRAMSGRSIGFFIGAAIGGFLVDKLDPYCDLMVAVCLDLGATATIVAPHAQEIALLWFLFVMQGTFEGIINIGKIQFSFNTPSCRRIRVKPLDYW